MSANAPENESAIGSGGSATGATRASATGTTGMTGTGAAAGAAGMSGAMGLSTRGQVAGETQSRASVAEGGGGASQGEGTAQKINVSQVERLVSVVGGSVLTLYGLTRGTLKGVVLALVGGSLIQRGATGHCDVYEAVGLSTAGSAEDSPTRILAKDAILFDSSAGKIEYRGTRAGIQGIVSLRVEDVVPFISRELELRYPDEQFLPDELEGVIQGLVNSVRWSVLRMAREQLQSGASDFTIESIVTSDLFSSRLMRRDEIVGRIENTSGLTEEMSEHSLRIVESVVRAVTDEGGIIEFEHIGLIRASQSGGYIIELDKEMTLRSGSKAGAVVGASASGTMGTDSGDTTGGALAAGAGA